MAVVSQAPRHAVLRAEDRGQLDSMLLRCTSKNSIVRRPSESSPVWFVTSATRAVRPLCFSGAKLIRLQHVDPGAHMPVARAHEPRRSQRFVVAGDARQAQHLLLAGSELQSLRDRGGDARAQRNHLRRAAPPSDAPHWSAGSRSCRHRIDPYRCSGEAGVPNEPTGKTLRGRWRTGESMSHPRPRSTVAPGGCCGVVIFFIVSSDSTWKPPSGVPGEPEFGLLG